MSMSGQEAVGDVKTGTFLGYSLYGAPQPASWPLLGDFDRRAAVLVSVTSRTGQVPMGTRIAPGFWLTRPRPS